MKNGRIPQRSKRQRWQKTVSDINATVVVGDEGFEKAFRLFKKKVRKSGLIEELKKRKHYIKPSEQRQIDKNKAARRRR